MAFGLMRTGKVKRFQIGSTLSKSGNGNGNFETSSKLIQLLNLLNPRMLLRNVCRAVCRNRQTEGLALDIFFVFVACCHC